PLPFSFHFRHLHSFPTRRSSDLTSSIISPLTPLACKRPRITLAPNCSGATFLNMPPTFPIAVRFASTMKARLIPPTSPILFQLFFEQFYQSLYTEILSQNNIVVAAYPVRDDFVKMHATVSYFLSLSILKGQ